MIYHWPFHVPAGMIYTPVKTYLKIYVSIYDDGCTRIIMRDGTLHTRVEGLSEIELYDFIIVIIIVIKIIILYVPGVVYVLLCSCVCVCVQDAMTFFLR